MQLVPVFGHKQVCIKYMQMKFSEPPSLRVLFDRTGSTIQTSTKAKVLQISEVVDVKICRVSEHQFNI